MNNKNQINSFINLVYIYHIKYIIYTVMIEQEKMIKQKYKKKVKVHKFKYIYVMIFMVKHGEK